MKVKLSILMVIVLFLNTGCYNYKDIDDVVFCTDMIVDVTDDDEISLHIRSVKGVKGLEETEVTGQVISFHEQDKTIFNCIRNATLKSNAKLNFSHCKAVIFTEKAVTEGITPHLDMLERDQEYNLRTIIAIYKGDLSELESLDLPEEKNIGIYYWDTIINGAQKSGQTKTSYLNDILNATYSPANAYTLPVFELQETNRDDKLVVCELAVMKDGKKVGVLCDEETVVYNMLMDNIGSTIIRIPHIEDNDKEIILEVVKASTKTETSTIDSYFVVKKTITINTSIGEMEAPLELNPQSIMLIKDKAEKQIVTDCQNVIKKLQDMDADILNVTSLYEKKYPGDSQFIFANTKFVIDVTIEIEGSSDLKDTLY